VNKVVLLLGVSLTGCSISPQSFENFCRANYRIQINDSDAWRNYLKAVIAQARTENRPPRLEETGPFTIWGHAAPQDGPAIFPKPVGQGISVSAGDHAIAVIDDYWTSHLSSRPDQSSTCGGQFSQLWMAAK
jgi:hypothetical protein